NIDIAERVLSQLCHFGSYIVGWKQLGLAESCVYRGCTLGSLFSLATDDAIIGAQLFHCLTRQDSLWTMCEVNNWVSFRVFGTIGSQVWAQFENLVRHLLRGQWRGSRLQNHKFITLELGCNCLSCRVDVLHIYVISIGERSWNCDDVGLRVNLRSCCAEVPGFNRLFEFFFQTWFNDGDFATVDSFDVSFIHVNAGYVYAGVRHDDRSGESDISKSDEGNRWLRHLWRVLKIIFGKVI